MCCAGLQDTRTPLYVVIAANLINIGLNFALVYGAGLGIAGSALGTLIAQTTAAAVLVAVIWTRALRARASWRFRPQGVLVAARSGLWLVLRTAALQTGITLTTFVAAAGGAVTLAAHQVVNSLWILLAFALDAIAIAGQAIIGRIAGRRRRGTRSGDDQPDDRLGGGLRSRVRAWPCGSAGRSSSACSVPTRRCRTLVAQVLVVVALVTPIAGIVYVLDGVLIGAGDSRYLALAGVIALIAYAPLALIVGAQDSGLVWLWIAYGGYVTARLITLVLRARGTAWMKVGASV